MSEKVYVPLVQDSQWAISREVGGRWICLIQNRPIDKPSDAEAILHALGIEVTSQSLDMFFPVRKKKGGRCPTLEVLELCNALDPTNPVFKKNGRGEVGV